MKLIPSLMLVYSIIALHPLAAMINPGEYPLQTAALNKAFPTKEKKAKEHREALIEVSKIEEQFKTLSARIEKLGDTLGFGDEIAGVADSLKTKAAIIKALTKCGMDREMKEIEEKASLKE